MVFFIIPCRDLCQHLEGGSGKQGPDGFLDWESQRAKTDDFTTGVRDFNGFHPWLPWWYFMVAIHGNLTGNHERTHAISNHQKIGGLWYLVILLIGTKCRPWGYGQMSNKQTALDQHWINKWHLGRKGWDLDYSPWIVVGLLSKWGRLYPYLSGPNFATHPCFPFVRDPSRCFCCMSVQSHSCEKQQGQAWIAHKTFQNGSPYFLHTQDIYCCI